MGQIITSNFDVPRSNHEVGQIISSDFAAPRWLRNPHVQTCYQPLLRRVGDPTERCERLELPDSDFLDLCWVGDSGPIAIILHGMEGSVQSPYVAGLMMTLQKRGWRAVLAHARGCSGVPNRLPQTYHAGYTQDLDVVYHHVAAQHPHVPIAVVGYSLGGSILLNWLGRQGPAAPRLLAAVAVSVPYRLEMVEVSLNHTRGGRFYQRVLIHYVHRKMLEKNMPAKLGLTEQAFRRLKTFRAMDDYVTSPLYGFAGADDYYQKNSCIRILRDITNPVLLLHAKDDPLMLPEIVPRLDELGPHMTLELSEHGGHVGFVTSDTRGRVSYWSEERIASYLQAQL